MTPHLFLTGATGLLGQYLLRDLLAAETPVAVLIRSRTDEPADARVEQVMAHWETELGRSFPRPVVLEGDIATPGLGLSEQDHGWVARNCNRMLHNAASLTFYGTDRNQEPWLSNLTGTRNVLELCRQTEIREFHHVSTAYVCGKQATPVKEGDIGAIGAFRNDYEHCKAEAEKLVRSASFLNQVTVYRPATIVGDSDTGYTTTYHGLYAYMQLAWVISQNVDKGPDGRRHIPVRLNLTGNEGRNLVPVNWVSAVIAYLVRHAAAHGKTYNLTPSLPVKARQLEAAMANRFDFVGPTFVGAQGLKDKPLNDLEKLFYGSVPWYEPYWAQEPTFDCTNTKTAAAHLPCPIIEATVLHRLIDFAVRDRWGKKKR
jgi:thioester reductase-like protein